MILGKAVIAINYLIRTNKQQNSSNEGSNGSGNGNKRESKVEAYSRLELAGFFIPGFVKSLLYFGQIVIVMYMGQLIIILPMAACLVGV